MAGLYFHIPYCKQACSYCNFHFSVLRERQGEMVEALRREMFLRNEALGGQALASIYLGGGTPSLLKPQELNLLLDTALALFPAEANLEITLEANPDDMERAYLRELRQSHVNRLSIGIQSFRHVDLQLMNRSHTAQQAERAVKMAQDEGFDNLTVDLIYGLPELSTSQWRSHLDQLRNWQVPHISAYALTVEPRTRLYHQINTGALAAPSDEAASAHFQELQDFARAEGYRHYELSNLAQAGAEARHNSGYWQGKAYLGIGPGAHSFLGSTRSWNVANNALYLKALAQNQRPAEEEHLSEREHYHEAVMTGLRLEEGLDLPKFRMGLSPELKRHFDTESRRLAERGRLHLSSERCYVPDKQRFFTDGIAADLFYV